MRKIAFTVDLDDWYHTPLIAGANFSRFKSVDEFFENWTDRFDYVTQPSLELLELLDKHEIKGTFFIIADMVERYPELMKALKDSGHEIAHHSLHHTIPFNTKTKLPTQSREEWNNEFSEATDILEGYFSREITGFRAPGAYISNWMISDLIKHGISYDSSLAFNSLYNKTNLNLAEIPRTPFLLNKEGREASQNDESLLEIPWANYKVGKWHLPGGGAFFFRLLGYNYFKRLLNQQLELGDTVFYLHSLDLSNEKFPLGNFKNRPFYWVGKGDRCFKNLEKLLLNFKDQLTTAAEISERNRP